MLDAAGCDVVLVETVGVGQSEVEIAAMADTTLVLLAPGMGDGIQAAKAGILEIGDLYVVNKADRDGADQVRRELRSMLALAERAEGAWRPEIVKTVASKGEGIDEVRGRPRAPPSTYLEQSGELEQRRLRRARDEIEAIAVTALRRAVARGARERRARRARRRGRRGRPRPLRRRRPAAGQPGGQRPQRPGA